MQWLESPLIEEKHETLTKTGTEKGASPITVQSNINTGLIFGVQVTQRNSVVAPERRHLF